MIEEKKIRIKWLGHASFEIRSPEDTVILIDPFLSGNPQLPEKLHEVKETDVITLTHGHGDHVGDTLAIYNKLRPKVVAIFEMIQNLQRMGLASEDSVGMNIGGEVVINNIGIAMVPASHSSTYFVDDKPMPAGLACGYIFTFENGRRLYHAGDTWLFSEMELIRRLYKPEIAFLPIGGRFTMDVRAARIAAEMLSPRVIIPMHYDTFPEISALPSDLVESLADCGVEVVVPEMGKYVDL